MKYFFPIVFLFIGCTTNPRIENLTSSQSEQLNSVVVLKGDSDIPYTVMGNLEVHSCISDEEALEGIRINAMKVNADAVINVNCQTNSEMDLNNNCGKLVKCFGVAVKYTSK